MRSSGKKPQLGPGELGLPRKPCPLIVSRTGRRHRVVVGPTLTQPLMDVMLIVKAAMGVTA